LQHPAQPAAGAAAGIQPGSLLPQNRRTEGKR
jgi:hypothetical protein